MDEASTTRAMLNRNMILEGTFVVYVRFVPEEEFSIKAQPLARRKSKYRQNNLSNSWGKATNDLVLLDVD
jgi:hypothetical protein